MSLPPTREQLADCLEGSLLDVLTTYDTRSPWQWAEEEVYISDRQTASPGPYSTALTPYVREPLSCYAPAAGVTDLTLCFGAQTSKTTTMMVGALYRIARHPLPSLWVVPTKEVAGSFVVSRWFPLVEDCAAVARLKPSNPDHYKNAEQQFARCVLNWVGSNSPADLASRPVGFLQCDEVDKFAAANAKEAGAVFLAIQRTKTFARALRVYSSTPTVAWGEIWQQFMRGDQRYFFVPCPHCGEFQRLRWPQVRWDSGARAETGEWDLVRVYESARYECEHCRGSIVDGQKTAMLRAGQWRATNPAAKAGVRSYHLSSLYAPWASCGFGALAVRFLEARRQRGGLQDFINGEMAEPWEERTDSGSATPLPAPGYAMGEEWEGVEAPVKIMTVDVQAVPSRHYYALVRAWDRRTAASRLVWAGRLLTWEEVAAKQKELEVEDSRVLVDSGFEAKEVYRNCARRGWVALKGEERAFFTHRHPKTGQEIKRNFSAADTLADPTIGTAEAARKFRAGCRLFLWSSQSVQDLLHTLRTDPNGLWSVAVDRPDGYDDQMNSHAKQMVVNARDGSRRLIWKRLGERADHWLDAECMNVVAAEISAVFKHARGTAAAAAGQPQGVDSV